MIAAPIAERVESSEDGNMCAYTSSVVRADTCRIRSCTVLMSSPAAMKQAGEKMSEIVKRELVGESVDVFFDVGERALNDPRPNRCAAPVRDQCRAREAPH